jgi:hypothetical protein
LTFDGLVNSESLAIGTDYTVTSAAFDNANMGSNKTVRMNVALVSNTKTDNYNLTNGTNYNLTGQRIDEIPLDKETLEELGVTVDLTKTPVEVTVPDNVTGLGDITVRYASRSPSSSTSQQPAKSSTAAEYGRTAVRSISPRPPPAKRGYTA